MLKHVLFRELVDRFNLVCRSKKQKQFTAEIFFFRKDIHYNITFN